MNPIFQLGSKSSGNTFFRWGTKKETINNWQKDLQYFQQKCNEGNKSCCENTNNIRKLIHNLKQTPVWRKQ